MELLTAPDDVEVLAAEAPATPVLRVRPRGDQRFRTVKILSGKCTIGSSPQCQVCLPAPDVRPLQCLITIEADAALVTRWAAGVRLNGHEFTKATLCDGDRLTIGEWDLEFAQGAPPAIDEGPSESPPAPGTEVVAAAPLAETTEVPVPIAESSPATAICPSSHAFADGLVLQLWIANHQARRRAKVLVAGIRAARVHADGMAADLSAVETKLGQSQAEYDSQLGDNGRLKQEFTERLRDHERQVAPLTAEIAELRLQLELANASIADREAQYEHLREEFTALESAPPAIDPQLMIRADELDAVVSEKTRQLEQVTRDLASGSLEREKLSEIVREREQQVTSLLAEIFDLRSQFDQANANVAAQIGQYDKLASEFAALQAAPPTIDPELVRRAEELETAVTAKTQQLDHFLAELESSQLEKIRLAENAREREEQVASRLEENSALRSSIAQANARIAQQADDYDQLTAEFAALQAAQDISPVAKAPTPADDLDSSGANAEAEPSPGCDATAAVEPASEFSPPSFIEQYRHLLEEQVAPTPHKLAPGGARPVIDDEFLSPAKAETCASPGDDSDDALESYMASMMHRVRSSAPSYESSQAVLDAADFKGGDSQLIGLRTSNGDSSETPAAPDSLAAEPFTFEAVKHATRKPALASDLTALRELANNSARTAIATHAHQRSRESAMTKVAIALTAAAAAAYLFISAPAIGAWQVWAGAATGAVGLTAAVQMLLMKRRGVEKPSPRPTVS